MNWFTELLRPAEDATAGVVLASALLVLMLVGVAGLLLGSIRVRGLGLGIAGVLFAGLALGHFGLRIDPHILEFARELGLILFVYAIGAQVGPGFFASLRRNGLKLNLMAIAIVLLGSGLTLAIWKLFMRPEDLPAAVGLLSGATTNTPSLAAAGGALREVSRQYPDAVSPQQLALPQQAYAVAYPFGIMGIILAMLLIKALFHIRLREEESQFTRQNGQASAIDTMSLEVRNPALVGQPLSEVPTLQTSGVVISRMLRGGQVRIAQPSSTLALGDVLLAVGPQAELRKLQLIIGAQSNIDVRAVPSQIESRRILVTQKSISGKAVGELHLQEKFGVNITRIQRNEIVLPVTSEARVQIGDHLIVVGEKQSLQQVASLLGDSPRELDHPQVVPIFIGIAIGVLLGMLPIYLPHAPMPVKLGLAGGPLIAAILLSYIGRIGPIVWYMPPSANFMLREIGIVLFLACVGLAGGQTFFAAVKSHGLEWFLFGAAITFIPLLLVGLAARLLFKTEYMTICGLLSGSMTDPPALAFATTITQSDAPSIAYATVYPLTMLLRVVIAQLIIVMLLAGCAPRPPLSVTRQAFTRAGTPVQWGEAAAAGQTSGRRSSGSFPDSPRSRNGKAATSPARSSTCCNPTTAPRPRGCHAAHEAPASHP